MQEKRSNIAIMLAWMAGITSIAVGLLPPLAFFATEYAELTESLSVEARMQAVILSRIVGRNPRVWKYESERLKEALQEFHSPTRSILIVDMEGHELAQLGRAVVLPIAREAEFFDYGVPAGKIQSAASLLPLLKWTGGVFVISGILGFIVFVPLRRIPLRALERSDEALASTNREYRTLAEGLTEGLILVDRDGTVMAANPSAARILCQPVGSLTGRKMTQVLSSAVRENGTPFDVSAWADFSAHGWTPHSERLGLRVAGDEGMTLWVLLRSRLASLPGSEPVRIAVSIEDITDSKRLEELKTVNLQLERRIQERTFRLDQATQELETLSHMLSHDLRSPLIYVADLCKTVQRNHSFADDGSGEEAVENILAETHRMSQLIDDLLSLADVTRREVQLLQVDLSALAWQVVDRLFTASPSRTIKVAIADGLRAWSDAGMMRTLLQDLFGNAWKFTERTAEARVEFGARYENGETVYFVRDNGVGFDQSLAGRLFVPFQRLHNAAEFRGTGIGLARAQRIIERHKGRIWVEGRIGAGATFYFTMRASQDARPSSAARATAS